MPAATHHQEPPTWVYHQSGVHGGQMKPLEENDIMVP